jgi:tetratricopeptide (TPR) repeat protein
MRAIRNSLIAISVMALFSLGLQAQTMTLSGTVLDEKGQPLQGAQVKIDRTDMKGAYKVKTDKKGNYLYAGLPYTGVYNVTLEVNGKDVDRIQGVRQKGGVAEGVNFDLRRLAAAAGGAPGGAAAPPPQQQNREMSEAEKAALEKARKEQEEAMAKDKALNDSFNAGKEAVNAKNWDAAIEAFTKASELASVPAQQHVVFANLADSYLTRSDSKAGAAKDSDIEKGNAAYAKAVELKPEDPAYHNNYALGLAKAKKFDLAQAELNKAAQLDPPSAGKYFYNLGAVYVNTGQNKPAGDAFKKAIDSDPNYADAYYQLGLVMFGEATTSADGKIVPPAGTADNFNKYLQLKPDGANADAAKAMLQAMGTTVETNINLKKQPAAKKK